MDPTYETVNGNLSIEIMCLIWDNGPRSKATLTKIKMLPTTKSTYQQENQYNQQIHLHVNVAANFPGNKGKKKKD